MKWVAGLTIILMLLFGLWPLVKLVSNFRDRQQQVAQLYEAGKQHHRAEDYQAAWTSFEAAIQLAAADSPLPTLTGRLDTARQQLRDAQEELAMVWLENMTLSQGQTFSNVVEQLVPVLTRGIANANGIRQADLLAHLGWAEFLRSRDGQAGRHLEQRCQEALGIDAQNPYAHANLGHWKLWQSGKLIEARQDFTTALTAGRARDYVRQRQIAALRHMRHDEGEMEILRVVNEMRKNNEKITAKIRSTVYAIYAFAFNRNGRFQKLIAAVPAAEQLATFRALFYGVDVEVTKSLGREVYFAALQEAAGQRSEALHTLRAVRSQLSPTLYSSLIPWVDAAVVRLSPR
jgi:tetratricopeptide (TPR) repeat protein